MSRHADYLSLEERERYDALGRAINDMMKEVARMRLVRRRLDARARNRARFAANPRLWAEYRERRAAA